MCVSKDRWTVDGQHPLCMVIGLAGSYQTCGSGAVGPVRHNLAISCTEVKLKADDMHLSP